MSLSPFDQITFDRFRSNLNRVRSLVGVYEQLTAGRGQGRVAVQNADILRAAVVFLHASLEDLLRSLEESYVKLQLKKGATLGSSIHFLVDSAKDTRKDRITLGEAVMYHYDKTVEDVVRLSVEREFSTRTYNNFRDVVQAIEGLKLDTTCATGSGSTLSMMMKRRHRIAHRADHNPIQGKGQHAALPISLRSFKLWLDTVRRVGQDLETQMSARRT